MKQSNACEVHGSSARTANRALLLMVAAAVSLVSWHVWVYGPTGQAAASGASSRPFPQALAAEVWDLLTNDHGILAELRDILPYFVVGILLAGYLRTYKVAVKLQALLKRHGMASVFLASLIGIITPLCACGTLTTAISLLFARFPFAPVMALLVTSPLMSPSTYLLTLNDLGPEWTVVRTIAAFSMGMFAGMVTHLLRDRGFRTENIFIAGAIPRGDFHDEAYPDERLRCNCKEKFGNRVAARTKNMFVVFLAKSSEMVWLVGKYVLVGVAIGSMVERYMPTEWTAALFGRNDALNIVWVTLGAVPMFLHQVSASSILYHIKGSLSGTLDSGAALAFMIGGPVTAMPTMVLFWTIFKKKVFALYMFVCIVGTILIALAFQSFVFVPNVDTGNPLLSEVRSLSGGASSVITKQNKQVRMVLDPGGRGLIAASSSDRGSRGGVVFDAGPDRFREGIADKYDNLRYVRNVADWLEATGSSADSRRILIYNTAVHTGDTGSGLSRNIVSALENQGYSVRMTDRAETPRLTTQELAVYSQLWLFFGDSTGGDGLSETETASVGQFSGEGRGLLIVADRPGQGGDALAAVNRLSSVYGVTFAGGVENREELTTAKASYFFQRAAGALGRLLKLVHKA